LRKLRRLALRTEFAVELLSYTHPWDQGQIVVDSFFQMLQLNTTNSLGDSALDLRGTTVWTSGRDGNSDSLAASRLGIPIHADTGQMVRRRLGNAGKKFTH
jgi:hypothetical protein